MLLGRAGSLAAAQAAASEPAAPARPRRERRGAWPLAHGRRRRAAAQRRRLHALDVRLRQHARAAGAGRGLGREPPRVAGLARRPRSIEGAVRRVPARQPGAVRGAAHAVVRGRRRRPRRVAGRWSRVRRLRRRTRLQRRQRDSRRRSSAIIERHELAGVGAVAPRPARSNCSARSAPPAPRSRSSRRIHRVRLRPGARLGTAGRRWIRRRIWLP